MMFWKKRIIEDEELGLFKWSGCEWEQETDLNGEVLQLSLSGSKSDINPTSLTQAKSVIRELPRYTLLAEEYLDNEDVEEINSLGELLLSSIYSSSSFGEFDLEFDLKNCGYIYVVVHFKKYSPYALSVGD